MTSDGAYRKNTARGGYSTMTRRKVMPIPTEVKELFSQNNDMLRKLMVTDAEGRRWTAMSDG